MLYKDDWEQTQQKFLEYWAKENHDRPLIHVTAPKEGYARKQIKAPEKLVDRWMDTEYVIRKSRETMASTYFGGESFPMMWPNLGPDIFGAYLGCNLEYGEDTSWAEHYVRNWDSVGKFEFDPENKWWKKTVEMTNAMVDSANGDYIVGVTDLHPGLDGLVSLRGPEELCMDLYDNPEAVKKRNFELLDIFKKALDELYTLTTRHQKGSTNWMGVWHPGKWYVTSTDFICMISKEMFDEFILDELLAEVNHLDATLFHLDGPGALKHLDKLLEIPRLNGIQWVYGAGQPTASHWIPVLKKIQDAGKLIHVYIEPEELDVLLENLRPEGVLYITQCKAEQDAKDLVKKAESAWKIWKGK